MKWFFDNIWAWAALAAMIGLIACFVWQIDKVQDFDVDPEKEKPKPEEEL